MLLFPPLHRDTSLFQPAQIIAFGKILPVHGQVGVVVGVVQDVTHDSVPKAHDPTFPVNVERPFPKYQIRCLKLFLMFLNNHIATLFPNKNIMFQISSPSSFFVLVHVPVVFIVACSFYCFNTIYLLFLKLIFCAFFTFSSFYYIVLKSETYNTNFKTRHEHVLMLY